ncbi:MAG: Ig-like domain-containing protein [Pirellulaceae bacterium]
MSTRRTWLRNGIAPRIRKEAARTRWRKLQHEMLEARLAPAGSIAGIVFSDVNGDGIHQPATEPTIPNRTVYIDANNNAALDITELSTTTDGTGTYQFDGVANGNRRLRLLPEPGSEQSSPVSQLTTHNFFSLPTITTPAADIQSVVDHVFDQTRGIEYVSTNDGQILRLDLRSMTFLTPLKVGIQLGGIDVTPDGSAIYVAEQQPGTTQSVIRKVDPDSGEVTNLTFDRVGYESGAWDIVILNNGKALFTTNYSSNGADPFNPVREIDLATDTISVRADSLGSGTAGRVPAGTRVGRRGDRTEAYFHEVSGSAPTFRYGAAANVFSTSPAFVQDNASSGIAFDPLRTNIQYSLASTQTPPVTVLNRINVRTIGDEYILNGNFETGDTSGWSVGTTGGAQWVINNGSFDPTGPATATTPLGGGFDLISNQLVLGTQTLTQSIVVPSGITAASLNWVDRIRSAVAFSNPLQQYRVRILDANGDPLQQVFSTKPGDSTTQFGPNSRSFNLTSLLQPLAGQIIQLSFEISGQSGALNVNLDNISLQINAQYLVNGDFETGDTSGWTTSVTGGGQWVGNDGTFDPTGSAAPTTPLGGGFDLVSNQAFLGTQTLKQSIVVPAGITQATFSWEDRIQSSAAFSNPAQQFRVRILDSNGNQILQLLSTNAGDPVSQLGPNLRSTNVTSLLQSYSGQAIQISFEISALNGDLNVNLDNVRLQITSGYTMVVGENLAATGNFYQTSISPDGDELFLSSTTGLHVYRAPVVAGLLAVVNNNNTENMNFGARPVNNFAPLAAEDVYNTAGLSSLSVSAANGVLNNDREPNLNQSMTAQLVTTVQHGSLTLNPDGSFTYNGNAAFTSTDSFTYQVSDGVTTSSVVSVLITKNAATGSTLSGLEFDDLDGDGIFEPGLGETVAPDVTLFLDLNDNGVFDSANEPQQISAADGTFQFTGLSARDYRVRQLLPSGTRSTWPVASSPSSLIVQANVTDIAFDTLRQILYISSGDDTIRRFSMVANAYLSPIVVGGASIGLDLAPDNNTLYVADSQEVANQAFIRKINLVTGSVTTIPFNTPGVETGCFDIFIGANGKALITTTSSDGSAVPVRELVLATDAITVRADAPGNAGGGLVGSGTRIFRGTDRSRLLLTEGTDASGPIFSYVSAADLFVDGPSTFDLTGTRHSAVSRDGLMITSDLFGPSLMDSGYQVREVFQRFDGGLGFDGTRDVFFAVDTFTEELVAYNVQDFNELYRVPLGENVGGLFYGQIGVIPDGQNLFLTTVSGVRAFDIGSSEGYLVTLGTNASVDNLVFGNISVPLTLHVAIPGGVMAENQGLAALTGTVSRTGGDLSIPLVVTLTSGDPTEAGVPTTVTILGGQTFATFPINAIDDNLLDGTQNLTISASATAYGFASDKIQVTDHELIGISLTDHSISEVGGQTVATVSRSNTDNSLPLTVTLTSSDTTEATIQSSVIIPGGQASITVVVNAIDDFIFDGTRQAMITGTAANYFSQTDVINVVSDDVVYRNLQISTSASFQNPRLYEYSPGGTRVGDISVQPPAGGDFPTRDLVVDNAGVVHIFDGTAEPYLTSIDEMRGTRVDNTFSGWSTAAASGTGGVARFGQYVFVSDMATGSGVDLLNGLIRIDTTDYSSTRFGGSLDYTDVSVGNDGLLYGLAAGQLQVYNPGTLAFVRTVTLPVVNTPVSIAVSSSGNILAVAGDNRVYQYDSTGALTKSVLTTGTNLTDIDLSSEGQLAASGLTGDVVVLDEYLMDAPVKFSVSSNPAFVSFGTLRAAAGLTLVISPTTFVESAGASAAFGIVSRPSLGSIASALTVNLSSSDTTEATVPASVTIPAGQVSATFAIAAVDDAVGDGPQTAVITATATGQASAAVNLTVTDDEFNYFTLSFAPTSMSESGGTLTGTVTRTVLDNSSAVTVNLSSDDTGEATVPATVIIPANVNSVTFTVTAVDDALRDGTQTVNVTASAAGIASGTGPLSVTDNEVDTINLSFLASSISENSDTTTGTVSRVFLNNSAALLVTLTSDVTTEASVPGTVTIPAGQNSVNFTISGVDDTLRDGTQPANITAAASGVTSVSLGLNVTDDEVDSLSVSFSPTTMGENGGSVTGTVTRSVLSNALAVVVNLSSGDTSEATVPANVTIPANLDSVTFTVTSVDDALRDGTQSATISASASGLASGNAPVSVTDDEVDTISLSILPGSISENGGTATGTVTRTFLSNAAALVVNLSSNDIGEAAVPVSVTIPANQNSATFTVSGVNDVLRDGTQTAVITASASGVSSTTANVSVTDDELDTLTLVLSADLMSENGGLIFGTLTRVDLSNAADLVVSLSSSNTGEATVPATVTIPANQNSATFPITAVNETVADKAKTVTITATAAAHNSPSKKVIVSDDETAYQNPRNPLDVVPDTVIVPGDVLAVVNILNQIGTGHVSIIMPQYVGATIFPDTTGDNFITAQDALLVINEINNPTPPPAGEGEFVAASMSTVAAPVAAEPAAPISAGQTSYALEALLADDSFWRQSKISKSKHFDGESDWNQVVAILAKEQSRRRGE